MATSLRPAADEAADYYFKYIDQVPEGDICDALDRQLVDTLALANELSETDSQRRYAPDKWTIKEVLAHVSDTERVFAFRAFWFGRGFEGPLPSFDHNAAMAATGANARPWTSHVDEFRAVRTASVALFRGLPEDAWRHGGIASGKHITVRALAWLTAGHAIHHLRIVREKYLTR